MSSKKDEKDNSLLLNNSDIPRIPDEDLNRLVAAMMKTLEMGIGVVYGQEDEGVPDAAVDCESHLQKCRAVCCTFQFALTKEEVHIGKIKYDKKRPFFIDRESDGYCPHLDRSRLKCTVWQDRPLRCRRYDCTGDPAVWPEKHLDKSN